MLPPRLHHLLVQRREVDPSSGVLRFGYASLDDATLAEDSGTLTAQNIGGATGTFINARIGTTNGDYTGNIWWDDWQVTYGSDIDDILIGPVPASPPVLTASITDNLAEITATSTDGTALECGLFRNM